MSTTAARVDMDPPVPTSRSGVWLPVAAAAVTLVFWASAFVVIRHVAHDITPGALSVGRLVVAALALAPLVLRHGWVRPTRREWLLLAVGGAGWFGVYNLALNEAERHIDAGTAALIIQVGPIVTALLATMIFGELLTRWLVLGMVIGFGGVAVIAQGFSGGGSGDLLGVLLAFVSALMYAVGVLTQKALLKRLPALQVTWVCFLVGAVFCLPFAGGLPSALADPASLAWIVYLGVFPTAIAFSTWAYALTHTDAGKLSLTTFLVPFLATLISWATLGEVPPALTFVGGALAIAGVLLTRVRPAAAPRSR